MGGRSTGLPLEILYVEEFDVTNNREFYIDTPLGKLKVYAKHDSDSAEDYPGVFIDLVTNTEDICLACVEYESVDKIIQTCVYGDVFEETPTEIIKHNFEEADYGQN